jgi:hypothetical protein
MHRGPRWVEGIWIANVIQELTAEATLEPSIRDDSVSRVSGVFFEETSEHETVQTAAARVTAKSSRALSNA